MIVTWNKNGLRLRVIDVYQRGNETWLMVCKSTCDNPFMGRFGVRAADTSAIDLLVIQ